MGQADQRRDPAGGRPGIGGGQMHGAGAAGPQPYTGTEPQLRPHHDSGVGAPSATAVRTAMESCAGRPRYAHTTIQYPVGTRLATQNICATWNAPTTINGASVTFDLTPSGTVQFFANASGLLYTNVIRLTQLIDVDGQTHSFNATLTFTETPCQPLGEGGAICQCGGSFLFLVFRRRNMQGGRQIVRCR